MQENKRVVPTKMPIKSTTLCTTSMPRVSTFTKLSDIRYIQYAYHQY